ncbi:MAG: helix-turn-helix domain-containing protein [Myxococcota bacterium]
MSSWREEIITVEEMAEHLGIKPRTVQENCQKGVLPGVRRFGKWVIPRRLWIQQLEDEALERQRKIEDLRRHELRP